MVIAFLIVAVAAIFNALMDSVENENFFKSIFSHLDQKFWYKRESWKSKKFLPGTKYHLDAWHGSKSFMIIAFLTSSTFYDTTFEVLLEPIIIYPVTCSKILYVALSGSLYNLTFNLFYNRIFREKNSRP